MEIKTVETQGDIVFCSRAILTFRSNLQADGLMSQTLAMRKEGFQMAYIPNEVRTEAAAIIGYRIFEMYRTGKVIYIDDLFTFPENRGRGYAGALLDHVQAVAETSGVKSVHLDSGYDLHPAHRLYLNKGFILACNHFARPVKKD